MKVVLTRPRYFVSLLALALTSGACKTKSELRREQDFEKLKVEVREARGDRADVEVISEELKMELARLQNLIDESAQNTRKQGEEIRKEVAALATRMQAIEQRAVAEEMASKQQAVQAAKEAAQPPPAAPRTGYEPGKKLFEEGRFEEAVEALKPAAKSRSRSDETRKAQYLLAESYFNSREYASAALEFSEYRKAYPRDSLVANCIYKQANAFKSMGKAKEARLFYQELIEKFPGNSLAAKSRREMRKLK